MSYGHSAEYEYLNDALKNRWPVFCQLLKEMQEFIPRPPSDYAQEREERLNKARIDNPNMPEEDLKAWVDQQVGFFSSPYVQFLEAFQKRFMAEYVTIVMLSHALCEAVINAILALGLANTDQTNIFERLERKSILVKWRVGPKHFFPSYKLARSNPLFKALIQLAKQRNVIVHYKVEVSVGGEKVLEGSKFELESYPQEIEWIKRFFGLPYELSEYMRNSGYFMLPIFLDRGPICTTM